MSRFHDTRFIEGPRRRANWVQRILLTVAGVTILVAGFFFIAVALIAGAFLALGVAARWWWVTRRFRAQAKASEALEGEYQVVERAPVESRLDR